MLIEYSYLLNVVLNHARDLLNSESLTEEAFLLSWIDVQGDLDAFVKEKDEAVSSELQRVSSLWDSFIVDKGIAVDELWSVLTEIVSTQPEGTMVSLETSYFRTQMLIANELATEANKASIDTDILLNEILTNPSFSVANIVKRLTKDKISNQTKMSSASVDVDAIINSINRKKGILTKEPDNISVVSSSIRKNTTDIKEEINSLTDTVKRMQRTLSSKVFGQDNAINVFCSGYFQSELVRLTGGIQKGPRASFLFAGPPGVGKTKLAQVISSEEFLNMDYMRFDMSEYVNHEASIEFIGSDNVYKGSKKGNFTAFVESHPKSIILLDEIEKAHISIIHLFLQILDEGRIRDSNTDKEISLHDTILIFTTNAGKQLYENAESSNLSNISRKVIIDALQKDINPQTNEPYFPAAICSRFASGNVVMFNHLVAADLCSIVKKCMNGVIDNLRKSTGITIDVDPKVHAAVLFAEGGLIDGRTASSRSITFINNQLFELFRLVASEKAETGISDIENIKISVDFQSVNDKIKGLFETLEIPEVLLFANDKLSDVLNDLNLPCKFITTSSDNEDDLITIFSEHDIKFVLIDPDTGRKDCGYLNIEDEDSYARNAFWFIKERYPNLPVYMLQKSEQSFNEEECRSFISIGVEGIVSLDGDAKKDRDSFSSICESIHLQSSIEFLARSSKVVSFETCQLLSNEGKTAEIRLFDFELTTAIVSEDRKKVLSKVSTPNVHFDDVYGANDAKRELRYFAEYLKNPKKYLGTGVSAPKGVILYGPPGTGKTMLAKAMACESDVTFISEEGNNFLKNGPEKVHNIFKIARKYAPSVLFIDEIDAIAKERTGYGYAEEVMTAFLTEMDGFVSDPTKPVFVLAATNFDVKPGSPKSLDAALMRRFDRTIFVDLPNKEDRYRFLTETISKKKSFDVSEKVINSLSVRSTGMSLAKLSSIIELALRSVIRMGQTKVTDEVLEDAFECADNGEVKKWSDEELRSTAIHEAGHAIVNWAAGNTPSYITIVARGDYGGYVSVNYDENKGTFSKSELLLRIRAALAGRAAEIVYYGPEDGLTTGASNDLRIATHIAQSMICSYGMGDDFGLAVVANDAANLYELSPEVRDKVNVMLKTELNNAIEVIKANQGAVDKLVDALIQKNHMSAEEIDEVLKDFKR